MGMVVGPLIKYCNKSPVLIHSTLAYLTYITNHHQILDLIPEKSWHINVLQVFFFKLYDRKMHILFIFFFGGVGGVMDHTLSPK